MALLARVKSKSFLTSSCQGLSEYVDGSSGIQFFTRLDLGEQWPASYTLILIKLTKHVDMDSFQVQQNLNKNDYLELNYFSSLMADLCYDNLHQPT